jgi:hypothetical protein
MNAATAPASHLELIERWEHVDLVLTDMPQHERQKHWDMSQWGQATECGTVACAAGHCGMNPWFRERGFRLDIEAGRVQIGNVREFFGYEGSQRIFMNSDARPVERVIDEVRGYIGELRDSAALAAKIGAPAVGEDWAEQGGVFAGIIRGLDGAADYALIVGPEMQGSATWSDATRWAASLAVGDFSDFSLPTRVEGPRLFATVKHLFRAGWYWLSSQYSSSSAYVQYFLSGSQDVCCKDNHFRARSVRRLVIR